MKWEKQGDVGRARVSAYCIWPLHQVLEPCVAEFQADDIIQLLSLLLSSFIIACPLCHGHLNIPLCVYIHDVHHPSTPYQDTEICGYFG